MTAYQQMQWSSTTTAHEKTGAPSNTSRVWKMMSATSSDTEVRVMSFSDDGA